MKHFLFYLSTLMFVTSIFVSNSANAQASSKGYNVLVASYNRAVPPITFTEKGFNNVKETLSYGQIYKYYIMGFSSEAAAKQVADEAIKKGFAYARVEDIAEDEKRSEGCCYAAKEVTSDEIEKLKNVFFDFDQSVLKPEGKSQLNTLYSIMTKNPTYVVEVHAHTDSKGSLEYNQRLANRRKNSVVNYLKAKGIAAHRVATYVHGEAIPVAKNDINGQDTEEGRKLNRRVELVVKDLQGAKVDVVEPIQVPTNLR